MNHNHISRYAAEQVKKEEMKKALKMAFILFLAGAAIYLSIPI